MTDASSTYQDSLPVSSDQLLEDLRGAGVAFSCFRHIPLRTVEDAKTVQGKDIPEQTGAAHIKNFYLRDKKKRNYLVTLEQDRTVDLKDLGERIGAGKLSFGSADRLMEHLGVRPGAVSPLAMVTGARAGVTLYLDVALQGASLIYMHPLVNDRTIAMTPDALVGVIEAWGGSVNWVAV